MNITISGVGMGLGWAGVFSSLHKLHTNEQRIEKWRLLPGNYKHNVCISFLTEVELKIALASLKAE